MRVELAIPDSGSGGQADLFDDLGVGLVRTDLAGVIEHWSNAAGLLYGRESQEMLGSSITALRSSEDHEFVGESVARELLSAGRWRGELTIRDARDRPLRLDVRVTVLVDGTQRPRGFEAVVLDVSERVAAEQRAAAAESRASLTDRIAGLVGWDWDPRVDRLVTSTAFTSLLGLDAGAELSMADSLAVMPLEDQKRVRAALDGMVKGEADALSVEHRVLVPDGSVRWLEAHCVAVRDPAGVVTLVSGITQDVTSRRRDKERLQDAEAFWLATLDSLSAHIAVLDEDGTVVAVNAAWRGFSEQEGGASDYVGSNYIAVCDAAAEPAVESVARGLRELLAGQRDEFSVEYACHSPSAQRWFLGIS
jgi:PAS domain S-box-containing protein